MASPPWHFLHAAPPHYTTFKLSPNEHVVIDGKLDEPAWSAVGVEWTEDLVDITSHPSRPELDRVNASLQARAKLRWSDNYLYVGVELREPFIFANITGHNGPDPPYHDNDVELFFDPSGSTQYYKEFELSARNATYDVLWGVPDGEDLACLKSAPPPGLKSGVPPSPPPLQVPVCVNTSFPGYAGSWTMATGRRGAPGGLLTATHYRAADYGRHVAPYAVWTAELRFPLRAGRGDAGHTRGEAGEADEAGKADEVGEGGEVGEVGEGGEAVKGGDDGSWHGGLLDAGFPYPERAFAGADPASLPAGSSHRPVYWHFDLSRAEHPRKYTPPPHGPPPAADDVFCPLGCEQHNLSGWTAELVPPSKAECASVLRRWPTLLGTDPWDCYWEWALADVGANAYMHRPLYWATLQFAGPPPPSTARSARLSATQPQRSAVTSSSSLTSSPEAHEANEANEASETHGAIAADVTCGQLEWPGRYLARLISMAQRELRRSPHGQGYTRDPSELVSACGRAKGCAAADLAYALSLPERFAIELSVESSVQAGAATERRDGLNDTAAAASAGGGGVEWALEPPPALPPSPLKCDLPSPCYAARVLVRGDDYAYVTTVDSNSKVVTTFSSGGERRRCLFVSSRNSLKPALHLSAHTESVHGAQ